MYRYEVVDTLQAFRGLADSWQDLLAQTGCDHLNLSHPWLCRYLDVFPHRKPFIILVYDHQHLVAALPLKITRQPRAVLGRTVRYLRFIGTEPSVYDWMQLLIVPDADLDQVMGQVVDAILKARNLWDVLDLRYLRDAAQAERLAEGMTQQGVLTERASCTLVPYLELPTSWDAYAAQRKENLVKNLRRQRNRFQRDFPNGEMALTVVPPSPEGQALWQAFFQRHIDYWAEQGMMSDLARYPDLQTFYPQLHRETFQPLSHSASQLLFTVLMCGDEPMSYEVGLWSASGYLCHLGAYAEAYSAYSPGVEHVEQLIALSIQHGKRIFEWGRGDEAYKRRWTEVHYPLWDVKAYQSPVAVWQEQGDDWLRQCYRRARLSLASIKI